MREMGLVEAKDDLNASLRHVQGRRGEGFDQDS